MNGCNFKRVLGVGVLTEILLLEQRPEEVVDIWICGAGIF